MSASVVEVAAAVLLRDDGHEFLLACRPAGKVYAGYWEFPGGKVEAGETAYAALIRELSEEMGIRITDAAPWLCRRFDYPHAQVRIHFFRVWSWAGEARTLEHSGATWQRTTDAAAVAPILPANGPILKALSLPNRLLISCAEEHGIEAELARIERHLAPGCLLQVRDKQLPASQRMQLARAAVATARRVGASVVINDDAALAQAVQADGLHLSTTALASCQARPEFKWVGASCHGRDEIARATALAFDYAALGCVQTSRSHPDAAPLGWEAFRTLIADTEIPVFALGGLAPDDLAHAQRQGAHGVALMRRW